MATIKFPVRHRRTGDVIFEADIACAEDAPWRIKMGLAVKWAFSSGANLSGADLSDADLSGADLRDADLRDADLSDAYLRDADLRDADLSDADLSDAYLRDADLRDADLRDADLSDAYLRGADLRGADLRDADLSGADLSEARNDLWDILLRAPQEVSGLLAKMRAGKIDGSVYQGDCACLVGTIANVRGVAYADLGNGLVPNSERPAERLFLAIREGDTPATHPVAAIVEGWIVEFQSLQAGG